MARDQTAGLIVIGNEILSGKVVDTNSAFLAQQLRSLGVSLRRMVVIPDEIDVIAAEVRVMRPTVDVLFTSGGVGPTHDDVTIAGVARGLGRAVIRHPTLERTLRESLRRRRSTTRGSSWPRSSRAPSSNTTARRASRPCGSRTSTFCPASRRSSARSSWRCGRVSASDPVPPARRLHARVESAIAAYLNRTLEQFPELLLGSYPKLNDPEYRVRITLESKDQCYVERALAALLTMLPPNAVVRTE